MISNIISYLKNISQKDLDFSIADVQFLAQGEYNQNYLITTPHQKYVFRINIASQLGLKNQITYEYNALKRIHCSGRTPKTYYVDDTKSIFPNGVLIMEYLEGHPLEYKKDLQQAAAIFQDIHLISLDKGDYQNFIVEKHLFQDRIKEGKHLLSDVWDSPAIEQSAKNILEKLLNKLENNLHQESYFINNPWLVICNTEVNSHNFIIGENHSWLIDWEKPVISDPCQDITQFLAPTTTLWRRNIILTSEEIELFYTTYETKLPPNNIRERVALYNPYLYFRALSWCASVLPEYNKPDKIINNPEIYQKIKEYLSEDFMNSLLKDIL